LEIVRVSLLGGAPEQVTGGFAPAWNPAVGPDGDIVFVSSRTGLPRLFRVEPPHAPVMLPEQAAFPSSLEAPIYDGYAFRFEDESHKTHTLAMAQLSELAAGDSQ
jgi:hypothetical protein